MDSMVVVLGNNRASRHNTCHPPLPFIVEDHAVLESRARTDLVRTRL